MAEFSIKCQQVLLVLLAAFSRSANNHAVHAHCSWHNAEVCQLLNGCILHKTVNFIAAPSHFKSFMTDQEIESVLNISKKLCLFKQTLTNFKPISL